MEEHPAELAVGDRLEAEAFLPFDEVGDRLILDRAKFFVGNVVRRRGGCAPRSPIGRRNEPTWSAREGSLVVMFEVLSWQRMDL